MCRLAPLSSICITAILLLLPAFCTPDDRLVPGKPLSPGATIISNGGEFALGFFSPSNSTPENLYLGIWYNIPQRTVVWVANRARPAISSLAPFLAVANTSNLVLSDASGDVLWTTNVTTVPSFLYSPSLDIGNLAAVLMDTGNLILWLNSTMLWQSFENPTDTYLPNMRVRIGLKTSMSISWKGPKDPSPGNFSFGADPSFPFQTFIWNGSLPIWRSTVWTGYVTVVNLYYKGNTSIMTYWTYVLTDDEISAFYTVSDGAPSTRYVMNYFGKVGFYVWNKDLSEWTTISMVPSHKCDEYGYCGSFGYCDLAEANPSCKCLDGFKPMSMVEWINGTFTQGCQRKETLQCSDEFLALPNMQVPDKFVRIGNKTHEECANVCRDNCSCVAYAYASFFNSSISKGNDLTRCLVWAGELVDAKKFPSLNTSITTGSDAVDTLYLRLAGLPGKKTKTNSTTIILEILASTVVIACIFVIWFCKFKGRERTGRNSKMLVNGGLSTPPYELAVKSDTHHLDFPIVKLEHIITATNNFSKTSMIGQGGFGKVYKGIFEGQEVAIKRLGRNSKQGMEEFQNEVVLIAKLQHKNLVRLLGCCVEHDEKLLIYEYLSNKSLDDAIFNRGKNVTLDWPTRFKIIKGVARGLLYLHHDSRLKIVHRDLKTSNILLDEDMKPKISDFGMARIFHGNQENANTRKVVGTYGYMAPEYAMEGIFSLKSDVYSFGVILLEVVSGVKISCVDRILDYSNLIVYAWNLWKKGHTRDLVDPSIMESCLLLDEALLCIHLGLLCVQENPDDRPLMSSIVFNLENEYTSLPNPNHPAYFAQRNNDIKQNREDILYSKNAMTLTVIEGR